jgi:hypothetical protein
MDGRSDQLLARTGLPEDENRCFRRSDLLSSIENMLESIALPDNMNELLFHVDLLTEVNIRDFGLGFNGFDCGRSPPKLIARHSNLKTLLPVSTILAD